MASLAIPAPVGDDTLVAVLIFILYEFARLLVLGVGMPREGASFGLLLYTMPLVWMGPGLVPGLYLMPVLPCEDDA